MKENIEEEIANLKKQIDNKMNEISEINNKIQKLKDMIVLPDLKGKCIKMKNSTNLTYIKVKDVNYFDNLIRLKGVIIYENVRLIGISYYVRSDDYICLGDEYEIISEDSFNKTLDNAIKSFKS